MTILLALCGLLVASLTSIALVSPGVASADTGETFFRDSGDVGVSQCVMPGRFGKNHATLNIWIRAIVRVNGNESSRLEIKGFAFMESLAQPWYGPQILNGEAALANFSHEMFIRPHKSIELMRLGVEKKTRRRNKVIPIWGNFSLSKWHVHSKMLFEFELSVKGLDHTCQLIADIQDTRGRPTMVSRGLGKPGQSSFLLSPFYGSNVRQYASALAWHISWHQRFGVSVHVLYVTRHLTEIIENLMIQWLVRQGLLVLIKWGDLPIPKKGTPYAHQVIVYNHGMLSLHADDSVVIVADLDEYLLTPGPTTAQQLFKEKRCIGQEDHPIGTLIIKRYDIFNRLYAARKAKELPLWVPNLPNIGGEEAEDDPSSYQSNLMSLPSLKNHPLKGYTFFAAFNHHEFSLKPLHQPLYSQAVYVHGGFARSWSRVVMASDTCARWLHVVNLHKPRLAKAQTFKIRSKWVWPLHLEGEVVGGDDSEGDSEGADVVQLSNVSSSSSSKSNLDRPDEA